MQLHVNIVHFLKLIRAVIKHVPLQRWIQLMFGGFKTVNFSWVNKIMIGYTWLFVYESAHKYEGQMNVAPSRQKLNKLSIPFIFGRTHQKKFRASSNY